ncbi:MAG: S8 family peptidase [Gemmatimonadaceae bacterium]
MRTDSAPVFDGATGVLRLPVVIRNLGTVALGTPARITFIADSANLFDQNGNLLPGKPDITAPNADSANATGRIGVWRYDGYLAPNGGPLAAGATSQRRWLEFRSTDWHNAIRISLSASAVEPNPNIVAEFPPDSVPKALMDSLGSILMPSGRPAIPDLLGVRFVIGATQAQRQTAIDAVRGLVVGGWRSPSENDGTYYVLVPAQRSDSLLLVAAETLLSLPQVSTAEVLYRIPPDETAYRRPNDGAGFESPSWAVMSSQSAGANWALEFISAPLAWGCATGSPNVRVAVVDQSYARNSEVDANVLRFSGFSDSIGFSERHGLRVTSVLAAPANNGRAIAGIMWRSSIDFRDYYANPGDSTQRAADAGLTDDLNVLEDHIVAAGAAGARVINLSRSNRWSFTAPDTSGSSRSSRDARTRIQNSANSISRALARLRASQSSPLLVIAAGNDNIDASYSGFNHVARRAADSAQVLVVSGITSTGARDDSTNFGNLVALYAPSRNVAAIAPPEVLTLNGGTSYAAPLVTGTAGLVLSFDPRSHMTAAELKRLILAGATDSIIEPNGTKKPVLNAFGALLQAAKRPGAPLCGNRMWAVERDVFAQRTNGPERIVELPDTWTQPNRLLPLHGGRMFLAASGGDVRLYDWMPNGFVAATRFPDPLETFKGTMQALQQTHDGDSTAYAEATDGALQVYATAMSGISRTGTPLLLVAQSRFKETCSKASGAAPGSTSIRPFRVMCAATA